MGRMSIKTATLMGLIISYFLVLGADIFGQLAIAVTAFEAPPRSLAMFQGDYVYDSGPFWRVLTSVTTVLAALALALNWRTQRRLLLLVFFVAFMVINAISLAYIFPTYIELVSSPFSDSVDPELLVRTEGWRRLALARWLVSVAFGFLPLVAITQRDDVEPHTGS